MMLIDRVEEMTGEVSVLFQFLHGFPGNAVNMAKHMLMSGSECANHIPLRRHACFGANLRDHTW
jgi:hypothetical protein